MEKGNIRLRYLRINFRWQKAGEEESSNKEDKGEETSTNRRNGEACQETIKIQEDVAKGGTFIRLLISSKKNSIMKQDGENPHSRKRSLEPRQR